MILPKWTGDNSDRSLISLAQFLQEVPSLPLVFDVDETGGLKTFNISLC